MHRLSGISIAEVFPLKSAGFNKAGVFVGYLLAGFIFGQ
jgi:hypothetical protein